MVSNLSKIKKIGLDVTVKTSDIKWLVKSTFRAFSTDIKSWKAINVEGTKMSKCAKWVEILKS